MNVSAVADAVGVTPETVRYYSRIGLLRPRRNPSNGYREFSAGDANRLRFLCKARRLGFSVADLQDILSHADAGDSPCPMVRTRVAQQLDTVREQIAELSKLAERLEAAMALWAELPDGVPDGNHVCSLIEALEGDA